MKDWKQTLYDSYVSTGQARGNVSVQDSLHLNHYPYFTKLIRKYLPKEKDIAIADLACGHGPLLYCLKGLGYLNVIGVDNSSEQVALAHELGFSEIKHQDMQSFLLANETLFDVIFLMDILEHLERIELFNLLALVRKSLKHKGLLIIHVPNAEGIFGMRIRYGDLTHELCFTPKSIGQALRVCGFINIACFEDKPIIHGIQSMVRHVAWRFLTVPGRLLLTAETGTTKHILSQNMLVIANAP